MSRFAEPSSCDGIPVTVRDGVRLGCPVTVRVPASSANLGPGFDTLGLALGLYDELDVEAADEGLTILVQGEGEFTVPRTEDHLVVRWLRAGLTQVGAGQPGLRLTCRNVIPHGRGLGSSAAAIVGGLVAARALLADPTALDDDVVFALAVAAEGHPDNVSASLFGGLTISWTEPAGGAREPLVPHTVRPPVHPDVVVVACVPEQELATSRARAMLPASVPHADAAFTAGRAALLVEAITRSPRLLFAATEERLHQAQRAPAMPDSAELISRLRADHLAAVVSGAGPSVLVFGDSPHLAEQVAERAGTGWRVLSPGIAAGGASWSAANVLAG